MSSVKIGAKENRRNLFLSVRIVFICMLQKPGFGGLNYPGVWFFSFVLLVLVLLFKKGWRKVVAKVVSETQQCQG